MEEEEEEEEEDLSANLLTTERCPHTHTNQCVCECVWSSVEVAHHWSAKLETMCRQELKANIYRALICIGSSEFPVWVSGGPSGAEEHGGAHVW